MKELIPKDEYGIFADTHDTARVDSLYMADFFEKTHRDVLRAIKGILSEDSGYSEEFRRCNFAQSSYQNSQNKKQPCYAMTAKQFRIANNIEKGKSIRPYLAKEQIDMLETLQKVDVGLLVAFPDYEDRKRHLEWYKTKLQEERRAIWE